MERRTPAGTLLESVLERAQGPGGRCLGVDLQNESAPGENYGSLLVRVRARVQVPDESQPHLVALVAKLLPASQTQRNLFNIDVAFKKEVDFYECVVPALMDFQSAMGVPALRLFPDLWGARICLAADGVSLEDAVLVLEDLTTSGFRLGERRVGLDEAHCRLAVQELAKLHALGIALKRRRPDVFWRAVARAGIFYLHNKSRDAARTIRLGFREAALQAALRDVPELVPHDERLRRAIIVHTDGRPPPPQEPFCTLTHCDLWTNNIMFSYDESGTLPQDVRVLDFQTTLIDSPVGDLLFFLYTSCDSCTLLQHFDHLIKHYHDSFFEYLRLHDIASEDLDWNAFQCELQRLAPGCLSNLFGMLRIVFADEQVDLDSSQDSVSTTARQRYVLVVLDWIKRGWI